MTRRGNPSAHHDELLRFARTSWRAPWAEALQKGAHLDVLHDLSLVLALGLRQGMIGCSFLIGWALSSLMSSRDVAQWAGMCKRNKLHAERTAWVA